MCRWLDKLDVKSPGLTWALRLRLFSLSTVEDSGIPSVVVKYVEIGKNTSGEGGYLDGF